MGRGWFEIGAIICHFSLHCKKIWYYYTFINQRKQLLTIVIHALIEGYIGENEKEAGRVDAVIEGVKDFLEILRHFAMAPSDQHVLIIIINIIIYHLLL